MSQPSAIRTLWYRWKTLRLPWRRKWLCGFDLQGNTFWEFRNALAPTGRPRRIAKYPRSTHHGDVQLTPAWMQWLRHTRPNAPTVQEQRTELARQDQLKELAAEADKRWEAKESLLDSPDQTGQTVSPFQTSNDVRKDPGGPESIISPVTSERAQVDEMERPAKDDNIGEITEETRRQEQVERETKKGDTAATKEEIRWQRDNQKDDPWARKKPSEGWQPQSWTPGKMDKR